MPAAAAASLIDVVLAERQPDSEPTCEKPRVMVFLAPFPVDPLPPVSFLPQAASAPPTTTRPAPPDRPVRKDLLLIIAAPLWTDVVASGGRAPAAAASSPSSQKSYGEQPRQAAGVDDLRFVAGGTSANVCVNNLQDERTEHGLFASTGVCTSGVWRGLDCIVSVHNG